MSDFKAIETEYNGYKFRSRLEARWAVFFDDLGFKYQYEPEGYVLNDGTKYLPDFYLPEIEYYAEVKGKSNHVVEDMDKIWKFVASAKKNVIILSEVPYSKDAKGCYLFPSFHWTSRRCRSVQRQYSMFWAIDDDPPYIQDDYYLCRVPEARFGIWAWRCAPREEDQEREYKRIQAICSEMVDNGVCDDGKTFLRDNFDLSRIQSAILKARKARFEHGECAMPCKKEDEKHE